MKKNFTLRVTMTLQIHHFLDEILSRIPDRMVLLWKRFDRRESSGKLLNIIIVWNATLNNSWERSATTHSAPPPRARVSILIPVVHAPPLYFSVRACTRRTRTGALYSESITHRKLRSFVQHDTLAARPKRLRYVGSYNSDIYRPMLLDHRKDVKVTKYRVTFIAFSVI